MSEEKTKKTNRELTLKKETVRVLSNDDGAAVKPTTSENQTCTDIKPAVKPPKRRG